MTRVLVRKKLKNSREIYKWENKEREKILISEKQDPKDRRPVLTENSEDLLKNCFKLNLNKYGKS